MNIMVIVNLIENIKKNIKSHFANLYVVVLCQTIIITNNKMKVKNKTQIIDRIKDLIVKSQIVI